VTMKPWMGWTAAAAIALTMTATTSFACDEHAQAADAKDPKAVAAAGDAKGCDKPCCAKKTAADAKAAAAPTAALPAVNAADAKPAEAPCAAAHAADGKSCPKKTGLVAKAEPAKDTPAAEPAPTSGANR
jgi:hypothetical protein